MNSKPLRQHGGSAIVNLILLAALAYVIFVGIQYAPQWVESRTVKSILNDVKQTQVSDPASSVATAREKVVKRLQINEMNDLIGNFEVLGSRGTFTITFRYDRELNLIYETRTIHHEYSVTL